MLTDVGEPHVGDKREKEKRNVVQAVHRLGLRCAGAEAKHEG